MNDQVKWFGSNFDELICLVKILLDTNDEGEPSEYQVHKRRIFKIGDVIVNSIWYSTTNTLQTQGSGFAALPSSLAEV